MSTHIANRTRVLTLIGTIITQFALGSVYTWSLFNAQLADKLSEPVSRVAFSFGILSLALAVASSMAGKMQERFGVRKVTIGAGILLGASLLLTAHATNLILLYVFAGFLIGFADGTGYLMTLSNCVKWFPERKGLISACAIGAYGLGSLGFKFINMYLLEHNGLESTFDVWGVIAMVMVIIGGLMMKDAPKQEISAVEAAEGVRDYSLAESMKCPQFWMLALVFLTVCMSGLYVIGVAKDIGQSYVHLSVEVAASAVAIIAVANLGGRLVLGVLSDKMARTNVIAIALAVCLLGVCALLFAHLNMMVFYFAVACIAFSFGGTITVFPSLVSDFFGLNNLTKNYGVIYLGFGIGSFIGSIVASVFGGFIATFYLMFALLVVSLVIALTIKLPNGESDAQLVANN
ncbi:L-lactate MFS transporter [Photobacterium leiognathi]|uniref:MFS transporter n=2 Tax=Photobacterium leiognathi TaxID=553611 RepID=A0A2T3KZY9_PHOLD|nr:OFA family MFS transporter [Photobacterium leiognathi]MCG3885868.1 OFA family MFS transporter [Photobacterium leiognathi]PHZ58992.1 MFS transporter [Photobacterium leiognathi]PSV13681.1 MFS transporter [Photobacterium leiognathi subsp. mandapamensis]PSW54294.1 MFS transporter [Photobacterium leiognathi subsp. mandapamensis]GAA03704.1 major Facilitator Superfamily protein [Photobacterium leiognathi subsp. mandapamensis svers.1.1.]